MVGVLLGLALLAACDARTDAPSTGELEPLVGPSLTSSAAVGGELQRKLDSLRAATAPFQSFDAAQAAQWSTKITSCMDSTVGGMGFHYGNANLIDGKVRVDQPEVLLYEPLEHGRLQLVGVEYIVPLSMAAKAPRLFGRDFRPNLRFQVWALHVWIWKDNPSGLFADWNPTVNCRHTTDLDQM
jgi:hypothetical protein